MALADFLFEVSQWVEQVGTAYPWLVPFLAFAGGVLSALAPCALAGLPLMIGYILGQEKKSWKRSLLLSVVFVAGLSVVFTVLGVLGAAASGAVGKIMKGGGVYVVGSILVVAGVWFIGLINIPIPVPNVAGFRQRGLMGAFLLGIVFAFTMGPCAGPILIALLALIGNSILWGGLVLFAYSMGSGVIIIIAGLSAGLLQKLIASKGISGFNKGMKVVGGVVFVLIGLFFLLRGWEKTGIIVTLVLVLVLAAVTIPKLCCRSTDR